VITVTVTVLVTVITAAMAAVATVTAFAARAAAAVMGMTAVMAVTAGAAAVSTAAGVATVVAVSVVRRAAFSSAATAARARRMWAIERLVARLLAVEAQCFTLALGKSNGQSNALDDRRLLLTLFENFLCDVVILVLDKAEAGTPCLHLTA